MYKKPQVANTNTAKKHLHNILYCEKKILSILLCQYTIKNVLKNL